MDDDWVPAGPRASRLVGVELIADGERPRRARVWLFQIAANLWRDQMPTYGTIRLIEKDTESFLAWAHYTEMFADRL